MSSDKRTRSPTGRRRSGGRTFARSENGRTFKGGYGELSRSAAIHIVCLTCPIHIASVTSTGTSTNWSGQDGDHKRHVRDW